MSRRTDVLTAPLRGVIELGHQMSFYGRVYRLTWETARRYPREVLRLVADVVFGSGGLAIIGGTTAVVAFMTAAIGVEVGLQGYTSLSNVGIEVLSGFMSSYANTREGAPILTGIALTATVGAGFTAQLGAMRVAEEIDALEVMAIHSVSFLVSSRVIAGLAAVIPLYAIGLLGSYVATRLIIVNLFGQAQGTYEHYFSVFLVPEDILWSFAKAIVMAILVMSIHCYYGYHASGGPAGVGFAVGRAVRSSLICVILVDLLMDLAIYGGASTIHIAS